MRVILRKMKMFALVVAMLGATLAMGKVAKADDSDMGTVVFSDYFVDNRNNWTMSGSNCVIDTNDDVATITHTSVSSDSKLTTKLRNLNPNKRYIVKGQIKGANLVQQMMVQQL